ncbi:AAA domain-containing protein [Mycena floridula]|nr:AAA domain-containing protein [Mycena floridula]
MAATKPVTQVLFSFHIGGPKILEQKGLSLGGLGVVNVNIGLGGKTLVELEQPSAYHSSQVFPNHHTFRPGDLARIEAHVSSAGSKKGKKDASETRRSVEGVVYKVDSLLRFIEHPNAISRSLILASLSRSTRKIPDLDIPERCRILKLTNSVTYDRMDKALDQLEMPCNHKFGPCSFRNVESFSSQSHRVRHNILGRNAESKSKGCNTILFRKFVVILNRLYPSLTFSSGTGKTHTLIEIIRQLTTISPWNLRPQRLLVCGASNLSVDNILERLLALPVENNASRLKVTRIGHPARVMSQAGILDSTLEVKASRTDQAALTKDVKDELEATLALLSGKGKGAKGKPPRGAERKKMWDDVKALRKECAKSPDSCSLSLLPATLLPSLMKATQALEAVCWIPIFKAKKLILAGDPMQLPPTILSIDKSGKGKKTPKTPKKTASDNTKAASSKSIESNDEESDSNDSVMDEAPSVKPKQKIPVLRPPRTLETTLFDRLERMYGPKIKRMLQVQYRMHSQICEFPSKTLYGSKLKSDPTVSSRLLADLPNAQAESEDDRKETLATPVVFYDTSGLEYFERMDGDGDEGSRCNENEATIVKNWVDELVRNGIMPQQISVITPYQAQVALLSLILRPQYEQLVEIGTVDGMQGREKDAVVISLVGFLKEKRRLNVAMTRAKRSLCIVGDSSTVANGGSYLKNWVAWLEANADVRYAGLD